ncbi:MAG TPA: hypothetical protein PLS50_03215 [Candidatus Dojkabacteria bacterium]|nr:hypothetical protein [Candidatus Dojkabacteria bacterium]
MDTLKNIALEVGPATYEKFKTELADILNDRTDNHPEAIVDYCGEVVSLLHLSYDEMHPQKQILIDSLKH